MTDAGTRKKIWAVMMSLPLDYKAEQVADLFWSQIGLAVRPEDISVRNCGDFSANAYVSIGESEMIDFLTRNFETVTLGGQKSAVHFNRRQWDKNPTFKVSVDQITVEFPTNRNGIRKL